MQLLHSPSTHQSSLVLDKIMDNILFGIFFVTLIGALLLVIIDKKRTIKPVVQQNPQVERSVISASQKIFSVFGLTVGLIFFLIGLFTIFFKTSALGGSLDWTYFILPLFGLLIIMGSSALRSGSKSWSYIIACLFIFPVIGTVYRLLTSSFTGVVDLVINVSLSGLALWFWFTLYRRHRIKSSI